jgi:hypothetical protein
MRPVVGLLILLMGASVVCPPPRPGAPAPLLSRVDERRRESAQPSAATTAAQNARVDDLPP